MTGSFSESMLVCLSVGVCASLGAAEPDRPCAVSPVQEVVLGDRARAEFLETHPLSADGNLAIRVDEIGREVTAVSDRPQLSYRFIVVQGDEPQAYSFPGGTICLTDGLARLYTTDDELAFALGHEIAHIALRHHINAYCQRVQSSPESPEHVMLETVLSRLSSNQEIEADRYGALYSVRAGFRYSSSHEALGKLQRASPATTGNAVHPEYDRRISDLKRFKRELDLSLESFHAGKAALRAGEIDEAISLFAYFVAEFPRSVPGQVNLGAAYLSRVRDKAGTPLGLAEALPILPDPGVVIRGTYDRIDLEQAGAHFARALRVDPDDATAHAGLGLVQVRLGELQDARRHLDDAVALEPDNPDLLLCSGNVFFFMDDYDQAKTRYLAALSLRVGWADAKKNLALSYEKLGMRNEAAALWSELYDDNRYRSEARRRIRDLEEQR